MSLRSCYQFRFFEKASQFKTYLQFCGHSYPGKISVIDKNFLNIVHVQKKRREKQTKKKKKKRDTKQYIRLSDTAHHTSKTTSIGYHSDFKEGRTGHGHSCHPRDLQFWVWQRKQKKTKHFGHRLRSANTWRCFVCLPLKISLESAAGQFTAKPPLSIFNWDRSRSHFAWPSPLSPKQKCTWSKTPSPRPKLWDSCRFGLFSNTPAKRNAKLWGRKEKGVCRLRSWTQVAAERCIARQLHPLRLSSATAQPNSSDKMQNISCTSVNEIISPIQSPYVGWKFRKNFAEKTPMKLFQINE